MKLGHSSQVLPSRFAGLEMNGIVAFDLETTGLRVSRDEITQVAACRIGSGESIEFTTFVNPGIPIPLETTEITRISDRHVVNAPAPLDALISFAQFSEGALLFGHDIYRFDFRFIKKHLPSSIAHRRKVLFIDTMDIFELMWPSFSRLSNSFDDILDRLEIDSEPEHRHRADVDAGLLSKVWVRLIECPKFEQILPFLPLHEAELPFGDAPFEAN